MSVDIDMDLLISLVNERPEIWDRSLEVYKDKNKTRDSWRRICSELNPTFDAMEESERKNYGNLVVKRWANIRDSYMKWKNKEKQAKKSGAGASKMRKYVYHDALGFLDKVRTHAETTSSIEPAGDTKEQNLGGEAAEDPSASEAGTSTRGEPEPSATQHTQRKLQNQGKKRKLDDFELRMIKAVETPESEENRHLMFFKGILPSLSQFTDAQTIDFQMGVLQLVKDIKKQTHHHQGPVNQWTSNPLPPVGNYAQPYAYGYQQPPQAPAQCPNPLSQSLLTIGTRSEHFNESSEDTNMYSPYSDTGI